MSVWSRFSLLCRVSVALTRQFSIYYLHDRIVEVNKQILKNIIFVGLFIVPFIPFLVSSTFFFPFIVTKAFAWRIIIEIVFASWILLALPNAEYRPKKSI